MQRLTPRARRPLSDSDVTLGRSLFFFFFSFFFFFTEVSGAVAVSKATE